MWKSFLFLAIFTTKTISYRIPKAKVEIYSPTGFQVSIPADNFIELFAFHGRLDEIITSPERGTWSGNVSSPDSGWFRFHNEDAKLKIGDNLYYWTYVIREGLPFKRENQSFRVRRLINRTQPFTYVELPVSFGSRFDAGESDNGFVIAAPPKCGNNAITTINGGYPTKCSGDLLFEENFDSSDLDARKWRREQRFGCEPDFEFVTYLNKNDGIFSIRKGIAVLKPRKLPELFREHSLREVFNLGPSCTGVPDSDECSRGGKFDVEIVPPIVVPQISTINSFSFRYGRIEIRAKLPNGPWIFPQIFLNPKEGFYGNKNYDSGQIRVAFIRGGRPNELYGGAILGAREPHRSLAMCLNNKTTRIDWSRALHVYSLVWEPTGFTLAVDGIEYCRLTPGEGWYTQTPETKPLPAADLLASGEHMAPFDKEFYITLGYGVGGHFDFPNDDSLWTIKKPWRNTAPRAVNKFWKWLNTYFIWPTAEGEFRIDYVKVYAI